MGIAINLWSKTGQTRDNMKSPTTKIDAKLFGYVPVSSIRNNIILEKPKTLNRKIDEKTANTHGMNKVCFQNPRLSFLLFPF